MGNEFQEFVSLLGEILYQLLRLCLDIICLALAAIALLVPWRLPYVLICVFNSNNRGDFELNCLAQFFISLSDILLIPFVCVGLVLPWRFYFVYRKRGSDGSKYKYNSELRVYFFLNAFCVIFDLIFGVLLIIVVCTLFHAYPVLKKLKETYTKERHYFDFYDWDYREAIFVEFMLLLLNIMLLPVFLIVLVTVYRLPMCIQDIKEKTELFDMKVVPFLCS